MNVLIADKFEQSGIDGLVAAGCEVINKPDVTPEFLAETANQCGARVLIVRSKKVPAAAIEGMKTVAIIVRAGAGFDNIDVAACTKKGVGVCNCPGMNAVAVAELTMAHLLCCDRRLPEQKRVMASGKWNKKEFAKARGLKGLTLGIVGVGAIGKEVIKRAKAFDMNVVAWSRSLTPDSAKSLGADFGGNSRADLLKMVGACDAISVHAALAPETKGLCNAEFFGAMRKGSYFINTSRGGLVVESALLDAIKQKDLRVGLDVFENQPGTPEADFKTQFADLPGACVSHHSGASTDQAQNAVAEETVRIIHEFKERGTFLNRVN